MGSEVVRAVTSQGDMELVGAVDVVNCGEDIGQLVGLGPLGVPVVSDLTECLKTVGGHSRGRFHDTAQCKEKRHSNAERRCEAGSGNDRAQPG